MRFSFFLTFIVSLFLFISLQKALAETVTKQTCLGTSYFSDGVITDDLIDLVIVREDDITISFIRVDSHSVSNRLKGEFSILENDDQILVTSSGDYEVDRVLIKFDKKNKQMLAVTKFKNAGVMKFEGTCFLF